MSRCIIYNHYPSQIVPFSLSHKIARLVAGVGGGGGKLSRAAYLAPILITKFKFWMLMPLVST